jgi:hypothetical protein
VQALAGSGTATLTASSPGYQTLTQPLTLAPSAAIFGYNPPSEISVLTSAGILQQFIALVPIDPVSLQPGQSESPRPGANISVAVTSSNPQVVAVTTPTVQIPVQQPNGPLSFAGIQPLAAGSAVVTLGPLAGGPIPASGNQIVYTVSEPQLFIAPITLGVDLEVPVQIKLGSSAATPKADVSITISGNGPFQLANATGNGQPSLTVTIPAGQRVSNTFYVQGLYPGQGALSYGGGSFPNFNSLVTITQTAFVIQEAANGQTLDLSVGAKSNLTIVPALSPTTTAASGPLSIRGGANPIQVAVASTVPSIASVTPAQVTFNPGDQQAIASAQGLSSGTTVIKLLGTPYDFSQPQSSISVVVK